MHNSEPLSFEFVTLTKRHLRLLHRPRELQYIHQLVSKMHDPDRWPIVFGPGGTHNVPALRLLAMVDGLEQSQTQFESRLTAELAKISKLIESLPSKNGVRPPNPAAEPRPAVMPKPIVEKVKEPGKRKVLGLSSTEKMGREIERALMNIEPEKKTKGNSVRDIKEALEMAFKGRPKQPEKTAQKGKVNAGTKKAPKKKQPNVPKRVVETKKFPAKTRVSHAAAAMADGDDYTVKPMEVEVEVPAKQKMAEKQPTIEQVKHPQPEKKGAERRPEKNVGKPNAVSKPLSLPQFSPETKPSVKHPIVKRRIEQFEEPGISAPPKRIKSPEKSPASKCVKSPEKASEPNTENKRCINPAATVYRIGRIAKLKTSQPAVKHESSVSPVAQPSKEPNRPAPSSLPSLEGPFDSFLVTERSNSDSSNLSPPCELGNGPSTSSLAKQPSIQVKPPTTPPPPDKPHAYNTISDEASDTDGDDDFISLSDPALELEIKREVQDAIINPTPVDLGGSYLLALGLLVHFTLNLIDF